MWIHEPKAKKVAKIRTSKKNLAWWKERAIAMAHGLYDIDSDSPRSYEKNREKIVRSMGEVIEEEKEGI